MCGERRRRSAARVPRRAGDAGGVRAASLLTLGGRIVLGIRGGGAGGAGGMLVVLPTPPYTYVSSAPPPTSLPLWLLLPKCRGRIAENMPDAWRGGVLWWVVRPIYRTSAAGRSSSYDYW